MRAVVADGEGGVVIADRPVPEAGAGEVLIKVAAAGVNRPDVLQRRGMYPPPPGAPDVLGIEVAAEVVAAGRADDHVVREEVCALVSGGGYAQFCLARAGTCLRVPEVLSLVEAA